MQGCSCLFYELAFCERRFCGTSAVALSNHKLSLPSIGSVLEYMASRVHHVVEVFLVLVFVYCCVLAFVIVNSMEAGVCKQNGSHLIMILAVVVVVDMVVTTNYHGTSANGGGGGGIGLAQNNLAYLHNKALPPLCLNISVVVVYVVVIMILMVVLKSAAMLVVEVLCLCLCLCLPRTTLQNEASLALPRRRPATSVPLFAPTTRSFPPFAPFALFFLQILLLFLTCEICTVIDRMI